MRRAAPRRAILPPKEKHVRQERRRGRFVTRGAARFVQDQGPLHAEDRGYFLKAETPIMEPLLPCMLRRIHQLEKSLPESPRDSRPMPYSLGMSRNHY